MERKPSKYVINKLGYMCVRVDLTDPTTALWYLEEAKDVLKFRVNMARKQAAEDEKKRKIEIASAESVDFLNKKMQ